MWRILFILFAGIFAISINGGFNFSTNEIIALIGILGVIIVTELVFIRKVTIINVISFSLSLGISFLIYFGAYFFLMRLLIEIPKAINILILFGIFYITFSILQVLLPQLKNKLRAKSDPHGGFKKIVDTSVIVDGRILDIARTGFLDGTLVVPEFVIKEIQLISDSPDSQKRIRGRRALDVLNELKNMRNTFVDISDIDYPEIRGVDIKLLELAKEMNAKVMTNDYNLNKVAKIHDIAVLNINDLALSLRSVVMPDDVIQIDVIKEGYDDKKQGIGYLKDGTMVVIQNARNKIGQNVKVKIVSVLQKEAGTMIFADLFDGPGGFKKQARNTKPQRKFTGGSKQSRTPNNSTNNTTNKN